MENYTKRPLNANDRRTALSHYEAYKRSYDYSLRDVYTSWSTAKEKAWDYCKELMDKFDGRGLKVISHSRHMFTAGFMFEEDGKTMFMFISPSRDIAIEVA